MSVDEGIMTEREVEDIVLELLAAEQGLDAGQLRERLEAEGAEMPFDSILMMEVLVSVEKRCGVRIPPDPDTARTMSSVRDFARKIVELLREEGQ